MLDFRPRVQTRNYLSRREQRRLLAWVMGIGLIGIACASLVEIREFFGSTSMPVAARDPSIDARFQPSPRDSGEPDAVSIVKAEQPTAVIHRDDLVPGVKAELLAGVRDDTPWIRSAEIDAWLNVWNALARSTDEVVERRSAGAVGFLELFQQPRTFRGKAVTIRGSARQATYVDAADNSQGIDGYYRVIIRPESGPPEPVFLYTLELPADFPTGEEIRTDIEATGIFFKRMVYPTKDNAELRRAPVVMARTLTWRQPVAAGDSSGGSFIGVLVALVALGVGGLMVATYWATRVRISTAQRRPPTLSPIDDRDVLSIQESLSKLAETDR
ncbi:MAG: hypothetical protein WD894_06180 [Pirellulales bacterium]